MTIQTLKHQYEIVQRVCQNECFEQFLCKEYNHSQKNVFYDIFQIKQRELVVKLILIFTEQMNNTAFTDFFECFSKDGELYVVFLHKQTSSLKEKLEKENCKLIERTLIGKKILEQILLLNMPDFLVYDILDGMQIQVSEAMDISFLYQLKEISSFETVTKQMIWKKMANVFELLFGYEISLEASEAIPIFLKEVRTGTYEDYVSLYQAYLQFAKELEHTKKPLKPNTFWFRVWDKIKEFWKKLKSFFGVFLVLAVMAYLIYSILNPVSKDTERFVFQRIGTLSIEELEQESSPNVE